MRVVFSNRAYAAVLAETTEKIKTETGGLFLGTVQDDTWYIIEAIDPGPKSVFEVAYFEYDQKYTQHLINKIANLYETKLSLIGLWHRHPGSFDQFSSTDDGTNAKYASMRKEGAISALVNIDPNFRITMYQVDRPCRYSRIAYDVGDHLIPDGYLRFKTPETYFSIMENMRQGNRGSRNAGSGYHKSASLSGFMKLVLPQLEENRQEEMETGKLPEGESGQEALIDEIVDDLTFMADKLHIETALAMSPQCLTVYQEALDKTTRLHFAVSQEKEAVLLTYEGVQYIYRCGMLTEAYGKAKAEKDAEKEATVGPLNAPVGEPVRARKPGSVISSVVKIIRLKRNED